MHLTCAYKMRLASLGEEERLVHTVVRMRLISENLGKLDILVIFCVTATFCVSSIVVHVFLSCVIRFSEVAHVA